MEPLQDTDAGSGRVPFQPQRAQNPLLQRVGPRMLPPALAQGAQEGRLEIELRIASLAQAR
jgi:hypothetical protein